MSLEKEVYLILYDLLRDVGHSDPHGHKFVSHEMLMPSLREKLHTISSRNPDTTVRLGKLCVECSEGYMIHKCRAQGLTAIVECNVCGARENEFPWEDDYREFYDNR